MTTTSGPSAATISGNLIMARPATAPLRRIAEAPFTRRTGSELAYTVVSALLAVCALIFIVPTLANGLLWGLSAPGVRKFSARSRQPARRLLGEVGIGEIRPSTAAVRWLSPRMSDPVAWRARAYYAIKVPLAGLSLAVAGDCWLCGLYFLTFPAWRALGVSSPGLAGSQHLQQAGPAAVRLGPPAGPRRPGFPRIVTSVTAR